MKKTLLQEINEFAEDRVTMPMDRFFALLALFLFGLWILVFTVAPLSIAKFISIVGLFVAILFATFMAAVNYWMIKMNLTGEKAEEDQMVNSIDKPEPIEKIKDNFIA
jgi:uncharacterized membrane protein YccF (DUF307 family)